jgi:hypothetical protein
VIVDRLYGITENLPFLCRSDEAELKARRRAVERFLGLLASSGSINKET